MTISENIEIFVVTRKGGMVSLPMSNDYYLGSGLIDHSQKMTIAAMQIADMKV